MSKNKKEVDNLDQLSESEIIAIFKRVTKRPVNGLQLNEIKRQIRVWYEKKGIKEKPVTALAISPEVKKMLKDPPKYEKSNYSFEYIFTDKEILEKSKQLARVNALKQGIEDEKKSAMSNFKDRLDSCQSEINILSRNINEGKEFVTKTCDMEKDFDAGKRIYYYEGVKVGEERMTAADYQLQAEFEQEEEKEEQEAAE